MKENQEWAWKSDWRRNSFQWEDLGTRSLMSLLERNAEKEDTWVWKHGETKMFTVKSAYRILKGDAQGDEGHWCGFLEDKGSVINSPHCMEGSGG